MKFKKSVLTLLITLLITSLFTCHVFADTYAVLTDTPVNFGYVSHFNIRYYVSAENNSSEVRVVIFRKNSDMYVYAVSDNSFNLRVKTSSNDIYSSTKPSNYDYYVAWGITYSYNIYVSDCGIPVVDAPITNFNQGELYPYAIYYTFGEGAIGPTPPRPDYGDLNISYSTKIAGNGQASLQNKDVLDWSVLSSNGYDLSSGAIDLRIVPGSYTASSQSNLMSLIYTDFVIDLANAYYLDSVPLNQMTYEMSWEDIIGHLNNSTPAYSWLSIQATEGQWLKNGWIWQYRIMIDGEYLTEEYLTIYTATSSGVSNAENIVNNNYNITLQNTINNINYINNDNSTWYYQDIAIPDYDSSNDSSSWLSTLIEVIGNLLNKLLDLIGGAFSSITDGIVNLINGLGVDILGVFTNLFNNIFSFLGNLDFTTSDWLLPQSYIDNIDGFTSSTNGILNVWFDNGLGLFILIPLLIWLLGVIL